MSIKTGVDIVYLPKFRETLKRGGEVFLKRVYLSSELKDHQITHLAGIFAAKEAVMKALGLPLGSWHDIRITYQKNGTPKVEFTHYLSQTNNSLSISHDGNYVIAQFVAVVT